MTNTSKIWPCRQNLYVKIKRLRWNNNAYIENMDRSSKRKQLMRVKKRTNTSKMWPCRQNLDVKINCLR